MKGTSVLEVHLPRILKILWVGCIEDRMMEQGPHNRAFAQDIPEEAFYAEPQRVQCLNFLLHLAPYSDGLLYVSGDAGSGKSTLIRQFLLKAGDSWQVCHVDAKQLEDLPSFLRVLQQNFGCSLQGENDRLAKLDVLSNHLANLQKGGLRPILIIDDAHELTDDIAEFLDELLTAAQGDKGHLSLILVGEEGLPMQPWFESMKRFGVHSFALTPLDVDEVNHYVQHRLRLVGLPMDVIAPSQMKKILKRAQGNLTKINQLAQSMVSQEVKQTPVIEANDFEVQQDMAQDTMSHPTRKPIKFSHILFGMLTVILALALYFEDEINEYFEPGQPQTEQAEGAGFGISAKSMEITTPQRIVIPEFDGETPEELSRKDLDEDSVAATDGMPPIELPAVDLPSTTMDEIGEGSQPEGEAAVTIENEDTQSGLADMEMANAAKEAEELVIEQPVPPSSVPLVAIEQERKPQAGVETPSLGDDDTVALEVKPKESVLMADEGVIRRESWILEQNPEHYTLQIMSFSQELGIAKTLENVLSKEKISYYKYKKADKVWYRLAYGIYPDRKSAQAEVAKGLPKELGKVDPWIRRLGDVQKEITSQ